MSKPKKPKGRHLVAVINEPIAIVETVNIARAVLPRGVPKRRAGGVTRRDVFGHVDTWSAAALGPDEARLSDLVDKACDRWPDESVAIKRWARRLYVKRREELGMREIAGAEVLNQWAIRMDAFWKANEKRQERSGPGKPKRS